MGDCPAPAFPGSCTRSPPRRPLLAGGVSTSFGRVGHCAELRSSAKPAPPASGPSLRSAPPHPRLRLRSGPLRVRAFAPVRSASSVSGPPPRPPTTVNVDGQCNGQGTGLGPAAALGKSDSVLCVLASERASLPPSRQSPIIPSPSLRGAGLVPAHPGENDLCLGKPAVFLSLGGSAFAVRCFNAPSPVISFVVSCRTASALYRVWIAPAVTHRQHHKGEAASRGPSWGKQGQG